MENQNVVFWWPNLFQLHSVFEMLIFGKLMKRRFQWYIGLPTFLLLFLLCVQSSKSRHEGSIMAEPPLKQLKTYSFKKRVVPMNEKGQGT